MESFLSISCLALVVTLFGTLLPQDPLAGYRHPEWQTFVFGVNSMNGVSSKNVTGFAADYAQFGVAPYAEYRQSGERLGLFASVRVPLALTPLNTWSQPTGTHSTDGHGSAAQLQANSAASWFPAPMPLGVHAELAASIRRTSEDQQGIWPESTVLIYQNRSSTAEIHFAVGPSFGRIREASPLLAALRIRAILQEEGLIEHELSAEEVEGLAQCVARSDYWSSAIRFDRSTRYWFDDIESFLRPRLHPGLEVPARVWFRIRDAIRLALPDVGYERITGVQLVPWVGFTARSEHRRQVWPTEGRADTTAFTTFERQVGGIELEGGYSATTRVYFHLKADWQPDISQSPLEWDENLQVSARYLVFDRLYVSAGWSHIATRRPRVFHDVHESPSVWAEWYVEDRLLLRGGPAYSWNDRWDTEASYLSRSASFYVSFDCRLF